MTLDEFRASLEADAPPAELTDALTALWHDARGDWDAAHECAQRDRGPDGAWVHGYLHRVEGDARNARGWYKRAGRPYPSVPTTEEWPGIARELLAR